MRVQFISLLAARGLASAIQAVTVVLLARWAGTEDFGLVSTITGVGAVLFVLMDWGLSTYIPVARARGLDAEVAAGIRLQMISSSCAAIAGALAITAWLGGTDGLWWFCLLPFATALEQQNEARLSVAIADGAKKVVIVSILFRRSVSLGVFVALFSLGVGALESYAISMLIASAVGLLHVAGPGTERVAMDWTKVALVPFYRRLTPYLVANISSQARSLDVGIVTATSSVAHAGLYSAAFRFTSPLMLVAGSAAAILLPHSSKKSAAGARKLGGWVALLALLSGLPLAVAASYSDAIVLAVFGEDFRLSGGAFVWALAVIPFMSLDWAISSILQGQGKQRFVAINAIVFAPMTLLAVGLGAVTFGATGAAAGMAISYMVKVVPSMIRVLTL